MENSLANIRDVGVLTSTLSSKGPLIDELYLILQAYNERKNIRDFRDEVVHGQILPHTSYHTRRTIWNHIFKRYFKHGNEWIIQSLKESAKTGKNSVEFLSLHYLYYVLRDRFTFMFITERLWSIWDRKTISIGTKDVREFLEEISEDFIEVTHWRESTKRNLVQNTIWSLTAFGLLKGKTRKTIQQPSISDEAVFHLLCILWDEGFRGKQIIEAHDWRMFLFTESKISYALNKLSILGWIRFEKSGSTVMIELRREPKVKSYD
ncbi:Putative inner membrane protein (DUF1819) [Thaumarchaeota archaeon SCGC AB-539-E09]|nr:Putative inner membrane protein (DUF1819) [Thaumarchaeota archaeon SCGC AB-539-E09]